MQNNFNLSHIFFSPGKSPVSLIPVRQANTILGWLIDKHRKSELSHSPEIEEKEDDTTFMVPRDYR